MVALFYMKWSEGRTSLFGVKSAAGKRRAARQEAALDKVDSYEDKSKEVETPIEENRQFASHV
jgi:high-affinity iron transporter